MELIAFSSILRQAWGLLDGHDYSDTNNGMAVEDFRLIRDTADLWLPEAWGYYWWPALTAIEKRRFRPVYSASENVTATTERFFIQEQKYYQALRAQSPAAQAPASAAGVENSAYWAECKPEYRADDYASGTAYVAGDQVYYPTNGLFYQCHTASTGNAPTNTSYWGVLTEFDQYVLFEQTGQTVIGYCDEIWNRHPLRGQLNATRLNYRLEEDRVVVLESVAEVFVEFRTRAPRLTGDAYVSTSSYSSGAQVYFEASGTGDFYIANQSAAAGDTPATDTDKWDKVEIPRGFQRFLVASIYDALRGQYNKPERADRQEFPTAFNHLDSEILKLTRQGQRPAMDVAVY